MAKSIILNLLLGVEYPLVGSLMPYYTLFYRPLRLDQSVIPCEGMRRSRHTNISADTRDVARGTIIASLVQG